MIEYSALIYKDLKNNSNMTNCITKNLSGFGKTEEEALKNLKYAIKVVNKQKTINLNPSYGLLA